MFDIWRCIWLSGRCFPQKTLHRIHSQMQYIYNILYIWEQNVTTYRSQTLHDFVRCDLFIYLCISFYTVGQWWFLTLDPLQLPAWCGSSISTGWVPLMKRDTPQADLTVPWPPATLPVLVRGPGMCLGSLRSTVKHMIHLLNMSAYYLNKRCRFSYTWFRVQGNRTSSYLGITVMYLS